MQKLAAKFIQVMQECSHIEKNGVNSFHKYKYATSADVMQKVNSALTKYGIASFVSPSLISLQDVQTAKGNTEHLATVEVEVKLVDRDSGEEAILKGLGNGQDSGDKAIAKGLTSALKYAYMMSLAISTGDDPEADQRTDENTFVEENENAPVSQQQQPSRQSQPKSIPQTSRNNRLVCHDCGAPITQKVANYSKDKYGRYLCFNCQQMEQEVAQAGLLTKKTVLKKITIYFRDSIEYDTDEEFEHKNDDLESSIQLDIDNMQQGNTDYEFNYIAIEDVEEKDFPFWLFN